jgi:hypothetical protein
VFPGWHGAESASIQLLLQNFGTLMPFALRGVGPLIVVDEAHHALGVGNMQLENFGSCS